MSRGSGRFALGVAHRVVLPASVAVVHLQVVGLWLGELFYHAHRVGDVLVIFRYHDSPRQVFAYFAILDCTASRSDL